MFINKTNFCQHIWNAVNLVIYSMASPSNHLFMCGKSGIWTIPNWIIQSGLYFEAIPHIFDKCTAAFHLKVFVSCIASHQLFSRTRRGQKRNLWITTHIALLDVSPRLVMIGNNIDFNQELGTMPGSIRCIEMLSHWVIYMSKQRRRSPFGRLI